MGETQRRRRVVVCERLDSERWAVVSADVGGERIAVSGARVLSKGEDRVDWNRLAGGGEITLVADAQGSICRFLEMAEASREQTHRMVALRLETELPYPVSESEWACERVEPGEGSAPGKVLLLAVPKKTIAETEQALKAEGLRCTEVCSELAGLAELAVGAASNGEGAAIVALGAEKATLAIVEGGSLRYARTLPLQTSCEDGGAPVAERMAGELSQSMYDYSLRHGGRKPGQVLLYGEEAGGALAEALSGRLDMAVSQPGWPEEGDVPPEAEAFVGCAPACVGTLIAIHRKARGEAVAAPALRRAGRRISAGKIRGLRVGLIAANVAAFLVLVAALFGVRSGQLSAAERVIKESTPLLENLDRVQSEVDVLRYESKRERSILDTLTVLSEVIPADVKIEELSIDPKGKVTISGKAGSVESASEKAISGLEESGRFSNAEFHGATQGKDGFGFRITCELRGGTGGRKQ